MPSFEAGNGCALHYLDEGFADAWEMPETALLLHGNAESGQAWNAWMPQMGRRFRVVRPDMRGFGRSTAMPLDYAWSFDELVADYVGLLDHLGIERAHVVAAKVAGPIAMRMAALHPGRVKSLVLLGTLVSGATSLGDRHASWVKKIREEGVESWARWTMPGRLGSACPPAMLEGWSKLMGATALSTQMGFMGGVPGLDVRGDLAHIKAPTMVVNTDASGIDGMDATLAWQRQIKGSELMIVPGDSYHVAASHPEQCAAATIEFIGRRGV